MLRTLIVDDEDHMRDSLVKLLAKHCPQVEVAGKASSVATGIKALQELHPDLVLLDIQMSDGTGFDLLNSLPVIDFKVIFITAFDQYALQAFRFSAVDYLLKPVNPELLAEAVERAGQLIQEHHNIQMQALQENLRNIERQNKKIILKTTENIYLLDLNNIISCESDNNYTCVYTSDGEKILVSKTLKEYDNLLAGCGFYRVHKSYLINLAHIKRFEKQDGGYIILTNDLKIPVASRKRDEMLELLEKMAE
ncbi:MAG: LytTR family DNA-binding domain-containing protein [Bacteroidales bacterium]|nr:LytTR family DNA-binding domain-containing protein [Bacteroidales bacterium]